MKRFFVVTVLIAVTLLCIPSAYGAHKHTRLSGKQCHGSQFVPGSFTFGRSIMGGFANIIKDGVALHRNLISLDSVKVLAGFTPAYISTRFIDEPLQERFYDSKEHKNINQMPSTFCRVVEDGAFGIMIALSSLAFIGPSEKSRLTGRIFGLGAIAALLGKRVVKGLEFKGGKRPWHEKFDCKKRSYGGFPSGHMVEAAYSATVFGWQYGYKAGIPLAVYAGLMFGVSVNRNRHYVSQVVAGTAVGVMYGIAANRLIDTQWQEHLDLCIGTSETGAPQFSVAYKF